MGPSQDLDNNPYQLDTSMFTKSGGRVENIYQAGQVYTGGLAGM